MPLQHREMGVQIGFAHRIPVLEMLLGAAEGKIGVRLQFLSQRRERLVFQAVRQLADSLEDKPFPPLTEELQAHTYFAFGSAEEHFQYRDAVRKAYLHAHFPVLEGHDHMQYQISDPQGFAALLVSVMEQDRMPDLPFIRR